MPETAGDPLRFLLAHSNLLSEDDIPELVKRAVALLGASDAVIYLIDMSQSKLVSMFPNRPDRERVLSVEGTLPGKAFTDISQQERRTVDDLTLWGPLLDGTERLGVLQLTFRLKAGDSESPDLRIEFHYLCALLAEMLVARRQYGDVIARTRRLLPMQLPAEMQWNILPPLTFGTPRIVISGTVEPAYEVGGDSFDYAVTGRTAHLAIFDAVGHGLAATLLAAVTVGVFRNARRSGLDLGDTVRSIDKWLTAQFGWETFVTGVIAELDIVTGHYRWINAGHPPALLLRDGRVVKALDAKGSLPLGLGIDRATVADERLQPGDRLLLYSDGVVEARDARGGFFGTHRLADFVGRAAAAGLPAPETLRRLNRAILEHQEGNLQDDATTLLVEWLGDAPQRLTS
jgi:serine phosphatase RsbU (regulator of sigma subunit)